MRIIPLANLDWVVTVDDEDYEVLWDYTLSCYGVPYPQFCKGYVHRFVMQRAGHDIKGKRLDHINGDTFDARKENLRFATHQQNMCNRGAPRNNTSGYKGVEPFHNGSYVAEITVNRRCLSIGYYATARDAAIAYDLFAIKHFGEFAKLNVPDVSTEDAERVRGLIEANKPRYAKPSSSRFYGVSWRAAGNDWRAAFSHKGQFYYVGLFGTEEEAAQAIDVKLIEVGNPKRLNFNRVSRLSV